MEELLVHLQYSKTLLYIALGTIILTYIIHFFFKDFRYPKYLPGALLLIIGGFTLINSEYAARKLVGIDNIFMGIVAVGSGIVGLCFALILGVYNKEKKNKNNKKSKKQVEKEEA